MAVLLRRRRKGTVWLRARRGSRSFASRLRMPSRVNSRIAGECLILIDLMFPFILLIGVGSLKVRALLLATVFCFTAFPDEGTEGVPAPDEIVRQYCAASRGEAEAFKGASMEVEIHGALVKMKKSGVLRALRRISALGRITYQVLGFEGDH